MDIRTTNVTAIYLGQRFIINKLALGKALATTPLVYAYGESGRIVLFRYGVMVSYGLSQAELINLEQKITGITITPHAQPVTESFELIQSDEAEGIREETFNLHEFDLPRLQLIAEILACVVVLDFYEAAVSSTFDYLEPLAQNLKQQSRTVSNDKKLLSQIGEILSIQGKMVGRVEVSEKPEVLWEYPQLERLYQRLEDEFEITERHVALERKLALITKSAETLLDLLNHKRSLRVEWYIVILIVIDIIVSLGEYLF
jgi:uncharacterized Rmd1/YagE family protein